MKENLTDDDNDNDDDNDDDDDDDDMDDRHHVPTLLDKLRFAELKNLVLFWEKLGFSGIIGHLACHNQLG